MREGGRADRGHPRTFLASGTNRAAADKLEWVTEARTATVIGTDYTLAEGGHANYWGQLAQRNCLRQLVQPGNSREGSVSLPQVAE